MNKILKKIPALVLTAGILCMNTPIYAYTKDETVYTKLNNNGTVNNIIVSEYLKNTQDVINDLSNLSDINNINGDEEIKKDGNKLTIVSNGKDILYQGKSSEALPISLNITYKLDGKETNIEDMLGKSGKVEITLKYNNLDSHYVNVNGRKALLYTPFVVTTSTIISSKNNSNIIVSNGKVVNNGSSNVIAAISTPGLYESLKLSALKNMDTVVISYDTTNFELSSIYSVATSKLLSNEDLDIFNDMDNIYSLVNELSSNSTLIVNGSNDLVSGSTL